MNFLISIPAIIWLLISALFFAAGEYLSKLWAMGPSLRFTILVVMAYALGTLTWLPALLHKNQLAIMGTLWLLLATLATISIGIFIFHEQLNYFQIVGIILAAIAMILLNLNNF